MRTETDVRAYTRNLEAAETRLEQEVNNHAQLHLLHPDAGPAASRVRSERQLLAVRAKLALTEWLLDGSEGYIPTE